MLEAYLQRLKTVLKYCTDLVPSHCDEQICSGWCMRLQRHTSAVSRKAEEVSKLFILYFVCS